MEEGNETLPPDPPVNDNGTKTTVSSGTSEVGGNSSTKELAQEGNNEGNISPGDPSATEVDQSPVPAVLVSGSDGLDATAEEGAITAPPTTPDMGANPELHKSQIVPINQADLVIKNLDTGEEFIIGTNEPDFEYDTYDIGAKRAAKAPGDRRA